MTVLIVETDAALAALWAGHLIRGGAEVEIALTAEAAIDRLALGPVDGLLVDLELGSGSAIAVADMARYRWPAARIVVVTRRRFFSDGSIFSLIPNASAFLHSDTPPEDLAAVVSHCCAAVS
ncbi:response regulator [Anianabacter salinae]|uniref:hypothetical protein n=1 Tax=Anianabacter salinae TaxID=2851023 RepID=UPI00225DEDF9|nr:hypothetical protein [Anianabacter salinae]MBV0910770.1 hypothetical protein [Anianabacter salinae]